MDEMTDEFNKAGQEIIGLRKFALLTTLKLLGYPSIESTVASIDGEYNADLGYRALGKVGHDLENYINLASLVKMNGQEIEVNLPENLTQEEFFNMCKTTKDRAEKDSSFMEGRDEILERSRAFQEGFELGMKEKLSSEDWALYESQIKEVVKFYLSANRDLLSPDQQSKVDDFTGLSKMDIDDKISDIIDSPAFSKAIDVEDRFTIDESIKFVRAVDEMIDGNEEVKKTSPAVALLALQKAAMDTRDKKTKFQQKYEELQEKYIKSEEEIKKIVGDGSLDQTDDAFRNKPRRNGDTGYGR